MAGGFFVLDGAATEAIMDLLLGAQLDAAVRPRPGPDNLRGAGAFGARPVPPQTSRLGSAAVTLWQSSVEGTPAGQAALFLAGTPVTSPS